jgi:hypothetical protein
MLRLSRWAAVMFTLLGAAGQAGARPSDQPQRMPVGPPDPANPSAAAAIPATPPGPGPAAAVPAPVPAAPAAGPTLLTPDPPAPAAVNVPAPQAPAAARGVTAARSDTRGGSAGTKAHRWRLFRRRSGDAGRPSGRQ